ncbi:hypothetical protein MASR2M47_24390 [Draconibacterium sp.]
MKKTNLLSITVVFAVFLVTTISAEAKIWRVNNGSNYNGTTLWGSNFGGNPAYPVFKQVDQAIAWSSVVDADTIHIESSQFIYDAATITKKIVLMGPGFFLPDNPKTGNNLLDAKIKRVNFNAGSAGSSVIGLNVVVSTNTADGYIQIAADYITIKRCRIERSIYFHITGGSEIQRVTILQNFFPDTYATNALYFTNSFYVPPVEVIFNNNICQKTLLWERSASGIAWNITQCKNNVFDGPDNLATPNLRFTTSDFSNNILMPVNAIVDITATPAQIAYNIGTQTAQFGTSNNNLVVPDISTLFVGGNSKDGSYQIKSGSQAYKNGSDGTDRGAFGGAIASSRYTLSGLAPVPVVYEVTTTGAVSAETGLPVTIKARTIK